MPTLAPILLARLVAYGSSPARAPAPKTVDRLRVTTLTTTAMSSIISGAFITATAMTNFPQAVFFGFQLFFVLEAGTWWTIHSARTKRTVTPMQRRLSLALSIVTFGAALYGFPKALLWATCAFSTTQFLDALSGTGFTRPSDGLIQEFASIAIVEIAMRNGLDIFLRMIAAVLHQNESERAVVRLLVEESVMFENRFMAQWLGVVTGLQLAGRVILHLRSPI